MMAVLRNVSGSPNLSQRPFDAVDRIVIGNWQRCDGVVRFWPFARQPTKHVPVASVRVSSHHAEVLTGADVLVHNTGWNQNDVTGADLDGLPVLSAKSQFCRPMIDTEHFMRCAMIVSKGIDAVSPRIPPIVLSESALEN